MCGRERSIDVAVAFAQDCRLGGKAGLELSGVVARPENCRQFLDLDRHKLGCVLGQIRVFGKYCRHGFADVTHLTGGKEPLPIGLEAGDAAQAKINGRNFGDVRRRPHRVDTAFRERGTGIDRLQLAVREVRANDAHM